MRRSDFGFAVGLVMAAGLGMLGCGNGANNVDACRELESARCVRAQSCGMDLSFPLHSGGSAQDNINACQLFYQDACLHGMVTWLSPPTGGVAACLNAIEKDPSCNTVINPQSNAACSWLNPPDAGPDTGVDAATDVKTTTDVVIVVVVDSGSDATVDTGVQTCIAYCNSICVGDSVCQQSCEQGCQQGT